MLQKLDLSIGLANIKNLTQYLLSELGPLALELCYIIMYRKWSRLLIHPRSVEGAHDFLGNSANTNSICQAKGEPGQAPVPTPTLETNKQTNSVGP